MIAYKARSRIDIVRRAAVQTNRRVLLGAPGIVIHTRRRIPLGRPLAAIRVACAGGGQAKYDQQRNTRSDN